MKTYRIKQNFNTHYVVDEYEFVFAEFAYRKDAEQYIAFKLFEQRAKEAQQKYYGEPLKLNIIRITQLLYALIEEAVEALREIPTRKAWANKLDTKPINWDLFYEELADVFLFLVAIILWSDISLTEFVLKVLKKQEYNANRKDHIQKAD